MKGDEMNTGLIIKAYCKERGITVKDFARMCGITEMSIHVWSKGTREPTLRCLRKIAMATGTQVKEWIGEKAA